jgi:ubiquinone/menaquinone biosynthesis C-methylase UbiE
MSTAPNFKEIYSHRAIEYDQLVSAEDHEGNILPRLQQVRPVVGLRIIELGAGTGRLTNLLAPLAGHIAYFDISPHMLSLAKSKLARQGHQNCTGAVADNRAIPIAGGSADLVVAGWSLGHLTGWHPDRWQRVLAIVLSEMKRVVRPGGAAIILETLGTGWSTPRPPNQALADYYRLLEQEYEFDSDWIRTDYKFASMDEAFRLISFFFGSELGLRTIELGDKIVPECTGIWWLSIP